MIETSFYRGRRVLVTGGTGMIGTQVVDQLRAAGAELRVASLDDPSRAPAGVEFVGGDLTEPAFCRRIVDGMEMVFHLAGIKGSVGIGRRRAASFLVPHLLMNTAMMDAAHRAGVERYLYTSSIAVYHPTERFVEDEAWDGPPHETDKYAAWAKRMGELQAEAYKVEHGWDRIAIVRPANVYGPRDNFDPKTAMVVSALIRRVLDGEDPLVVWGDGSAVRDFVYAGDVAEGMLLALERGANCTPINLGSGRGVTIRELVEQIVRLVPKPPEVVWDTSQPSGQSVRVMDTSRAEQMIGFRARTSLAEGLRRTIDWYLANGGDQAGRYSVFEQRDVLPR
jgi:GDP-L-fucose synthase